mmetsp:Transcript_17197/g.21112  ORF Transcript_17197/g.21112 Transcript_17197/m.21112 type:complete len:149 (+) Transcript_17197:459-905(+)
MLEHPHKIPHAITVLMHDWEIHRQLMDVGFTYLNGMVALRKFRGNASRCIESLFLPENTDDSNEELQPYFLCRGNGAGTVAGVDLFKANPSSVVGVVQKFLSGSGLPSFWFVANFNCPKNRSFLGAHHASKNCAQQNFDPDSVVIGGR